MQEYSVVLIRGSRVHDLPMTQYAVIRGKFDAQKVNARKQARSKYGVRKPEKKPFVFWTPEIYKQFYKKYGKRLFKFKKMDIPLD